MSLANKLKKNTTMGNFGNIGTKLNHGVSLRCMGQPRLTLSIIKTATQIGSNDIFFL